MSLRFSQVRLELPDTPRELRRLAAAVMLCKGEVISFDAVPHDYLPLMKGVHTARVNGLSWREALAEVGLELSDEQKMLAQIEIVREDLRSLWPQIQRVTGVLQRSGNPVAVSQALEKMRVLMT